MKAMVDRFDRTKVENDALKKSIKQKDEDIAGLVTRIIGEYEKATFKARCELLKEYKQGLLVDVDVDEEIELYVESIAVAGAPTSAPSTSVQPATAVCTMEDEISPVVLEPSTTDGPRDEPLVFEKVAKQ